MRGGKLLLVLCGLWLDLAAGGEFMLLAENNAPLAYAGADGRPEGVCVDIAGEIQKRAGTAFPVTLHKWVECLEKLNAEPQSALLGVPNDYALRKKFTFAGEVSALSYTFFAARDKDIKADTLEEAKEFRIGVRQNGVAHQLLMGLGFTNFFVAESEDQLLPLLLQGSFDLWVEDEMKAYAIARERKIDPAGMRPLMTAFTAPLFVAFNPAADAGIREKWGKALEAMRADGTLEKILAGWKQKLAVPAPAGKSAEAAEGAKAEKD